MKTLKIFLITFSTLCSNFAFGQYIIPAHKVLETKVLNSYLNANTAKSIGSKNELSEANLAAYFRQRFSERFFYDWNTFPTRFELYKQLYDQKSSHISRADDHMQKYAANTTWKLPFNYLNGEEVNAYAVRHLARQHKMVDVAFSYFYNNKDPKYIQYFIDQRSSLNTALINGKFEQMEDGNGTYESFRCGYRVLNWLMIHNMFLGEKAYTDHDQLVTIATLLQHGASLYEENASYQPGNHQTRGVSALAMIAILLRDFKGTDLWYERAMERLGEHLDKEINADGFQFERSVHYHISDIENYFYVYQLAQISKMEVKKVWSDKIKALFTTLSKIAYPDKSAPVLQDDTDRPWAEKNDISGTMTLGYLLFNDPTMGYFADTKVESFIYWFLNKNQIDGLSSIERKKPNFKSLAFADTHYYIMRQGWEENDKMMIISAGLDSSKPDHQHGDMLGIQAMANGKVILPNYQVNYPTADFQFFKNSMVKNVALVDNELQGKEWTGNQGGSGFGKFKKLPNPTTISWITNKDFDFYAGSHDGFENIGVKYSRQVIYIRNDFWIVKDNFESEQAHEYKQVWQGHYTSELQPDLLRANFDDATGCDILQLNATDKSISSGARGKEWSVVSKTNVKNFDFISIIFPYSGYSNRINELIKQNELSGWKVNSLDFTASGDKLKSLQKSESSYLFHVKKISIKGVDIEFSTETDVFLQVANNTIKIQSIANNEITATFIGAIALTLENKTFENSAILKPGMVIECKLQE